MVISKCPYCYSEDIINEYEEKQAKKIGASVGATLGVLAFGPLGLITGAIMGSKMAKSGNITFTDEDKEGIEKIQYRCKKCGESFIICPKCENAIDWRSLMEERSRIIREKRLMIREKYLSLSERDRESFRVEAEEISELYSVKCPYCQNNFR